MSLFTITGPDALASVTALFNFLSTPAGQDVVEDFRKVNSTALTWIKDLIGVVHQHTVDSNTPVEKSQDITKPIPPIGQA